MTTLHMALRFIATWFDKNVKSHHEADGTQQNVRVCGRILIMMTAPNYLFTYLLTYLLHGAESFLRS